MSARLTMTQVNYHQQAKLAKKLDTRIINAARIFSACDEAVQDKNAPSCAGMMIAWNSTGEIISAGFGRELLVRSICEELIELMHKKLDTTFEEELDDSD